LPGPAPRREERVHALLSTLRQSDCGLAREGVAGATTKLSNVYGSRRAAAGSGCDAAGAARRPRARLRRGPLRAASRHRERNVQLAPGLLGEQGCDPPEEALADALQVERRRAEQAQSVAVGLERQRAQPGFQRERRQIAAETAQNAVPQLIVGGHRFFPE
jgi:hypothetical protein